MTLAEATGLIVAMTAELREARCDRESYRRLAQQALHALHAVTRERDQLRDRYHHLLERQRSHRAA
jgi:hypothetical protein